MIKSFKDQLDKEYIEFEEYIYSNRKFFLSFKLSKLSKSMNN